MNGDVRVVYRNAEGGLSEADASSVPEGVHVVAVVLRTPPGEADVFQLNPEREAVKA